MSNTLQPYGPDYSPPGSSFHGILQARIWEWVTMLSSRNWTCVSYVSCSDRWVLYCSCHLGSPSNLLFMKWKHMSRDLSENVHSDFVENSLKMLSCFSCVWLFVTPWTVACRLLCPWDSPSKNTGVSCHAFLQGIFPTQGWNPCLMSPALADGFFTSSPTWEAPGGYLSRYLH